MPERRARKVRTKYRRKKVQHKDRIVRERGYKKITLEGEYVTEISYRPTKCRQEYRAMEGAGRFRRPPAVIQRGESLFLLHHE